MLFTYRDDAYTSTIMQPHGKTVSLVDSIIIEIIKSGDYNINALVSFNIRDFSRICQERKLQLLSYPGGHLML